MDYNIFIIYCDISRPALKRNSFFVAEGRFHYLFSVQVSTISGRTESVCLFLNIWLAHGHTLCLKNGTTEIFVCTCIQIIICRHSNLGTVPKNKIVKIYFKFVWKSIVLSLPTPYMTIQRTTKSYWRLIVSLWLISTILL